MSIGELMPNICAYLIQSSTLLVVGLLLPKLLGLRNPHALLTYYRILLPMVVLYPLVVWMWPSENPKIIPTEEVDHIVGMVSSVIPVSSGPMSIFGVVVVLVGVSFLRLVWIAIGMASLRKMRRNANPLQSLTLVNAMEKWIDCRATFLLSDDNSGPATFGWINPTVLLPADFITLPGAQQRAIVCHELLHVKRNDWLLGLIDEVIRALLWFHPAVWSLLGRIALCREQSVDLTVVKLTGERKAYLEVLKSIAVRKESVKAIAHGFLSKSQLYQRVVLLMKESGISKPRLVCTHMVFAIVLLTTGLTGAEIFPLGDYTHSLDENGSRSQMGGLLDVGSWIEAPRVRGRMLAQVFGGFAAEVMDGGRSLIMNNFISSDTGRFSSNPDTSLDLDSVERNDNPAENIQSVAFRRKTDSLRVRRQTELRHFAKRFVTDTPVRKTKSMPAATADLVQMQLIERSTIKTSTADIATHAARIPVNPKHQSRQHDAIDVGYLESAGIPKKNHEIERKYPETRADLVFKIEPEYPKEVVMEGIAGDVVFNALVNPSGSVTSVKIVETDDMRFNPPVLQAVKRWRYHPATKGGVPVASWVSGKIQFVCREEYPGSRILRKCRKRNKYGGYLASYQKNPKS